MYKGNIVFIVLLGHLLLRGRPEDISSSTPADVSNILLDAHNLPSSLLNKIVVVDILKPYLTPLAWKNLKVSIKKRNKMSLWACPVCSTNTVSSRSIECESCLEWFHFQCVRLSAIPKKTWFCDKCCNV